MTGQSGGRLAASYFADLFTIDVGDGVYAFLPFLVTAIAVGVLLAAAVFTLLRAMEASFLRRLTEAGADSPDAGKTLSELGYAPGSLRARWLLHSLHSPTCILYRNASSVEYDRIKAQLGGGETAKAATGNGAEGTEEDAAGHPAADSAGKAGAPAVTDAAGETGSGVPARRGESADERRAAREEAQRQRRLGLRIPATGATRFYIPADRRAYVEERASKFSADDVMGLVYTAAATGLVWFILLNVLEPLLKALTK